MPSTPHARNPLSKETDSKWRALVTNIFLSKDGLHILVRRVSAVHAFESSIVWYLKMPSVCWLCCVIMGICNTASGFCRLSWTAGETDKRHQTRIVLLWRSSLHCMLPTNKLFPLLKRQCVEHWRARIYCFCVCVCNQTRIPLIAKLRFQI